MSNQYVDRIEAAYDGFGAAHAYGFPTLAADVTVSGRALRLCGVTVRETEGAAAIVNIWTSGTVGQGELIDTYSFLGDETLHHFHGDRGILCPGGVSIEVVSGIVAITLSLRDWMGDAVV